MGAFYCLNSPFQFVFVSLHFFFFPSLVCLSARLSDFLILTPPPHMLSCQLKYIFSISLLSQTFRTDFSVSPFPPFPSLILLLSTGNSYSITLEFFSFTFICPFQTEVKIWTPPPHLSPIAGKLNCVYWCQTAVAIFYNFIFACHRAPVPETTVICFSNQPTQISFWWMATGAGLCWQAFFIRSSKTSVIKVVANPIRYCLNDVSIM